MRLVLKLAINRLLLILSVLLTLPAYSIDLPDEMNSGDKKAYLTLLEHLGNKELLEATMEVYHIYEKAPRKEGLEAVYVHDWKEAISINVVNTLDSNGRLVSLTLHGMGIKDLSLLKPFTELKFLRLSGNELHSLVGFPRLPKLSELILRGNFLTGVPQLNLPNLRYLDISDNPILTLRGLKNYKLLSYLKAKRSNKDGGIRQLDGLGNLTKLKDLNLEGQPIESIDGIENLKNLELLMLRSSKINGLAGIVKLTNLVDLNVAMTNIKSLAGIENLKKLKSLDVSGTKIVNIEGVEKLISMEKIFLLGTEVSSIKPLENLKNLKHVLIVDTGVTDLYQLLGLTKIQQFRPPSLTFFGKERPDALALSMEQRHVLEKILKRGEENYKIAQEEKYRAERKAEVKANKAILRVRKKVRAYKAARLAKE